MWLSMQEQGWGWWAGRFSARRPQSISFCRSAFPNYAMQTASSLSIPNPKVPQWEIVLNRFSPRSVELDEETINKALTMPAKWKVPSDYIAVRKAQNAASPIAFEGSPISQAIRQMARSAPGYSPPVESKKKKFSIFGLT